MSLKACLPALTLGVLILGAPMLAGAARADCPDGYCDDGYTLKQHGDWWARKEAERKARWTSNTGLQASIYAQCLARWPYRYAMGSPDTPPAYEQMYQQYDQRCRQEAATPPRDFEPVDQSQFPR